MEHVVESFHDSTHEIDEGHRQVMENVLEDGDDAGEYELLYHLPNPERPG